ncbi:VPLPA-CTERM sorting domain-containing protein [Arenibacterium sp. CAU 1754]
MKKLLLSTAFALGASMASAATLDFTVLGSGDIGSSTASIAGANITSSASSLFVGAGPAAPNSICAFNPASFSCDNDLEIDFTDAVQNVTFEQGFWSAGDLIDIYVYDAFDALAGVYTINSAADVDLSGFGVIGSLFFDDQSTAQGVAYGNITYEVANVPLPASAALLVGALGVFGAMRRRRKA